MSIRSWWLGRKARRRAATASKETIKKSPLREFVYLDVVSLHSLLVSQNMTIPDNVSQAISRADEAEISSSLSADALVGKGEVAARYQTSNSNSLQSSRKAVIQTLFKEFRELPLEFNLATQEEPRALESVAAITTLNDRAEVMAASALSRGSLVEIEVTLSVDPVFKLGAMMTEWSAMASEYPQMFGSQGLLGFLRESEPVMKVLERFLAGLIPIRATAKHHVVVEVGGIEYVVDGRVVAKFGLSTRPLQVVGVTEHLGYWKDIRRVLFSGGEFTILCRVAKGGIQKSWTPVKLADLFSEVAPDFVNQINAIRSPTAADSAASSSQNEQQKALAKALENYKTTLVSKSALILPAMAEAGFAVMVQVFGHGQTTAAVQRQAFDQVRDLITAGLELQPIAPDEDLAIRQDARKVAGLELFPSLSTSLASSPAAASGELKVPDDRLLDVEVIAIYW